VKRYILAITGASGSVFGIRVLRHLAAHSEVHLVFSSQSIPIIKQETGICLPEGDALRAQQEIREYCSSLTVFCHGDSELSSPLSSGSFPNSGMLVVPCTMKTLSGIANGYASNLIERAADVTIKEGRHLLLSPREMPFSAIHLENMLKLARIGVTIAPPVPGFYHSPKNIEDIIDFVAGKILDAFMIEHDLFKRWGAGS
jgi:flavin prenyltransferase